MSAQRGGGKGLQGGRTCQGGGGAEGEGGNGVPGTQAGGEDKAEVQWRAAEVVVRQRAMAQEVSKKRMREEPEAGPVGEVR